MNGSIIYDDAFVDQIPRANDGDGTDSVVVDGAAVIGKRAVIVDGATVFVVKGASIIVRNVTTIVELSGAAIIVDGAIILDGSTDDEVSIIGYGAIVGKLIIDHKSL